MDVLCIFPRAALETSPDCNQVVVNFNFNDLPP